MPIKSFLLAGALAALTATSTLAGDLTIAVEGVRNGDGTIRIALHDGEAGFPSDRKPFAVQAVPANPQGVRVVFAGLASGTYAATLFHDEDGDEKLGANLVGMPTEGIAFSNDAAGSFGPASFEDASFVMPGEDLSITTTIAY